MPLPDSPSRTLLHTRTVLCKVYRRADGLTDVEGHIEDLRAFGWHSHWGEDRMIGAEVPVHAMWLRFTLDDDKVVVAVASSMDDTPFPHCKGVADNYAKLVGLKVEGGFMRQVNERIGGAQGCTHVTSLIPTMTTTLIQSMATEIQRWEPGKDLNEAWRARGPALFASTEHPDYPLLNTCWSHAENSPVVKVLAPLRFKGDGCN